MFIAYADISDQFKKSHVDLMGYLSIFLSSQHPGRDGKVCPFFKKSADTGGVFIRTLTSNDLGDASAIIRDSVELLLSTKRVGAVILNFSFDVRVKLVDSIQDLYKEFCVEKGMMIGSLNPGNFSESVRLSGFYPLRCPEPILVIRPMVYTDLTFLGSRAPSKRRRKVFLSSYIKMFSGSTSEKIKAKVTMAKKMLEDTGKWWRL